MKVSFNVAGITFAVKENEAARRHVPQGAVELRHVPFVHPSDPARNDPNAVEVWSNGVRVGYIPKNSDARAAFFEMKSEGADINASVTKFLYAVYDGNLNVVEDTFNDMLDGYLASVEIEFDAAITPTHYTIGGKDYVRVTCVSSMIDEVGFKMPEHLFKWMTETKVSDTQTRRLTYEEYLEKLENTRLEGNRLHDACREFVQHGTRNENTPRGLDGFVAQYQIEFLSAEQIVTEKTPRVAGRYDLLANATIDGARKKYIVDWKRGSKIKLAYMLQCAFYAKKTKANGFLIVLFGGKNKCGYSVKRFDKKAVDTLYEVFMSFATCLGWLGEFPECKLLDRK